MSAHINLPFRSLHIWRKIKDQMISFFPKVFADVLIDPLKIEQKQYYSSARVCVSLSPSTNPNAGNEVRNWSYINLHN